MKKLLIYCLLILTLSGCGSVPAFVGMGVSYKGFGIGMDIPVNNLANFESKHFGKDRQTILFQKDYSPNADGRIGLNGMYLPFDTVASKFIVSEDQVGAYLLYDNGSAVFVAINPVQATNGRLPLQSLNDCVYEDDGIYSISGDSLIADVYMVNDKNQWYLSKHVFRIHDHNTLQLLSVANINNDNTQHNDYSGSEVFYRLSETSGLPSSFEAMNKREKWLWENKDDWKAYKKDLKKWEKQGCQGLVF